MKRSCFIAGLTVTAFPCVGSVLTDRGDPDRPNVLLLLVDDLRPTLGCYGDSYALTPNIDRIAALGTVFTHAYCQQAVSNPSRASMLTGLRPDQTGVTDLNTHFREKLPDAVTLPQLFKNHGYYTAGAGKVFHSGGKMRDDVSWTEQRSAYDRREYILESNMTPNAAKTASVERADVPDEAYPDGMIAADAIGLLRNAAASKSPFFLAVGFKKPHLPFCAPDKYWRPYDHIRFETGSPSRPEGSPGIAFHNWNELRGYTDIPDEGPLPDSLEQELLRGYYASVSYMDAQLGKVIDELERLGFADNTVIVLWGDNGFHLGEQGLWCKSTNFEPDTRIPLIVAKPGQRSKAVLCPAIVESVDIYPTVAGACGLELPGGLTGKSLSPLLDDPGASWDNRAFSQFPRPYEAITRPVATTMGYTVRTPEWRCTCWYDLPTGEITDRELYRMDGDNLEKTNVSGQSGYSQMEARLAAMLDEYRKGNYRYQAE